MMVSPGAKHGGIGGLVGLRAGVRLHRGRARAPNNSRRDSSQVLDDIGVLAAAVVALAGIAFGVTYW